MASAEPLRAEVEAAGLDFGAVGPPWHESDADALLPDFGAAGSAGQLAMFATLAPAVVPDLLALADDLRPQLLVREPYEFAAWLAADQPICAMGCVLAGVAESLAPVLPPQQVLDYTTDPTAVTATQVSQATTRVLETPTYRQAAQRIAAEIATAPPPSTIRPWLTSLAGNG